jgi:hypothetical protein
MMLDKREKNLSQVHDDVTSFFIVCLSVSLFAVSGVVVFFYFTKSGVSTATYSESIIRLRACVNSITFQVSLTFTSFFFLLTICG